MKRIGTLAADLCMVLQAITECACKEAISALEDKGKLKVVKAEVRVEGAACKLTRYVVSISKMIKQASHLHPLVG